MLRLYAQDGTLTTCLNPVQICHISRALISQMRQARSQ